MNRTKRSNSVSGSVNNSSEANAPLLPPRQVEYAAPADDNQGNLNHPIAILNAEDLPEQIEGSQQEVPGAKYKKAFRNKHPRITTVATFANDHTNTAFVLAFATLADYLYGLLAEEIAEANKDPKTIDHVRLILIGLQVAYTLYYLVKAGFTVFSADRDYDRALVESGVVTEQRLVEMYSTKASKLLPVIKFSSFAAFLGTSALLAEEQFNSGLAVAGIGTALLLIKSALEYKIGINDYSIIKREGNDASPVEYKSYFTGTEVKTGLAGLLLLGGAAGGMYRIAHDLTKDNTNPHILLQLVFAALGVIGTSLLATPFSMIGNNARATAIDDKIKNGDSNANGVYANHATLFFDRYAVRKDLKDQGFAVLSTVISSGLLVTLLHSDPAQAHALLYVLAGSVGLAGAANFTAQAYAGDKHAITTRLLQGPEERKSEAELVHTNESYRVIFRR